MQRTTNEAEVQPKTEGNSEPENLYDRAFEKFHEENPEVYFHLVRLAREARAAGFAKFGVRTLWETMRWHFALDRDRRSSFKLNDHLTAPYARLIMAQEPDLAGMFETRESARQ